MIFKILSSDDSFIDKIYSESMADLNKFYELDWIHHLPKIVVVSDRRTINKLRGAQTEPWIVGWTEGKTVYVLDRNSFDKESDHKYSDLYYSKLIKHELSHLFYNNIAKGHFNPCWLSEGAAIYVSGQNFEKTKPVSFSKFLKFYDKNSKDNYEESGFAVQCLVERHGKEKLFELIRNLSSSKPRHDFEKLFEKIYGFFPNYDNFNKSI